MMPGGGTSIDEAWSSTSLCKKDMTGQDAFVCAPPLIQELLADARYLSSPQLGNAPPLIKVVSL